MYGYLYNTVPNAKYCDLIVDEIPSLKKILYLLRKHLPRSRNLQENQTLYRKQLQRNTIRIT